MIKCMKTAGEFSRRRLFDGSVDVLEAHHSPVNLQHAVLSLLTIFEPVY